MQYQIPLVKPQFQQGATVQRTDPVPPPNQPDLTRYAGLQASRYLVAAPPQLHQGPTIQQTYIFPPNQPALQYPRNDTNRASMWEGPDQFFDGATTQATHPVPSISQPQLAYYRPDANRFQAQTRPPFDSAAVAPQTSIFPPSQPELSYYRPDINRYAWEGPDQILDGPTIQQSYIFPLKTVIASYRYRMVKAPFIAHQTTVPTQADVFATNQPDLSRYAPARLTPAIPPQINQGATIQDWFLYPPSQPEQQRFAQQANAWRTRTGPAPQFDGATIQQTSVFPPNQPELSRFGLPQLNRFVVDAVRRFDGAGVIAPQTYIFPVSQPELSQFLRALNSRLTMTGPAAQLQGATIQQSYIFPPNQPDLIRVALAQNWPRFAVAALPRFDGAAPQQTYVFVPPQPEFRYYLRNTFSDLFLRNEGATIQPGYIFPVSQPELIRYNRPDINRYAPTGPQKQVAGATVQQGLIFPVSNPEARWYARQRAEGASRLIDSPAATPRVDLFTLHQPTRQHYRSFAQPQPWTVIQDAALARLIALNARFNQALALAGGFSQTVGMPARFGTVALNAGVSQTMSTNARFNPTVPIKGGL